MTDPGPTSDRESVHARLIDAPRERVFRAIAQPELLSRWWGPEGFTSTFEAFEFRPDGPWRLVLHGPDGSNYPNRNVFREIVVPERVVVEHLADIHHFFLTITLEPDGERTRVGWQQVFDTAQHLRDIHPLVSKANEQNLDRLAAVVRELA